MYAGYIKSGLKSFYSRDQIQAYLQRVEFIGDIFSFRPNYKNLEQLIRLHLLTFPFENSRLHYAESHEVDVNPEYVYSRLVEQRLGGSWCCGHNGLFLGILRGLGYRVVASCGRVNQSPPSQEAKKFTFLSHMVLLVQLDDISAGSHASDVFPDSMVVPSRNQTYLVDVGFGGTGIVRPMLLEVGHIISGSAPPEEHRLVQMMHPDSSLEDKEGSREWVVQYRCGSHQPNWTTLYIFGETEAYTSDWIAYSQWLCEHPVDLFLHNVVAVRHFIVEGQSVQDNGKEVQLGRVVMMGTRVQRRIGTQSQTIREFHTECDRVRILKDDFGIVVDENEARNIKSPAALP